MAHIKEQLLIGYYIGEYDLHTLQDMWVCLYHGDEKKAALTLEDAFDLFKAKNRI